MWLIQKVIEVLPGLDVDAGWVVSISFLSFQAESIPLFVLNRVASLPVFAKNCDFPVSQETHKLVVQKCRPFSDFHLIG